MPLKRKGVVAAAPIEQGQAVSLINWCPTCNCNIRKQEVCLICQTPAVQRAVVICVACEGSGWNSKKGKDRRPCYPCDGKGHK